MIWHFGYITKLTLKKKDQIWLNLPLDDSPLCLHHITDSKKIPMDQIWLNLPMDDWHFGYIMKNDPQKQIWIIRDTDEKG
jgi:hypothetical protein